MFRLKNHLKTRPYHQYSPISIRPKFLSASQTNPNPNQIEIKPLTHPKLCFNDQSCLITEILINPNHIHQLWLQERKK